MAVTNITYIKVTENTSPDTITIHNPVNLFVDAYYDGVTPPDSMKLTVYGKNSIGSYLVKLIEIKCIIYQDFIDRRRFIVRNAQNILQPFMKDFTDTLSPEKVLDFLDNMSLDLRFVFESESIAQQEYVTLLHAATQIREKAKITSWYNKEITYTGAKDMPVYLYFYNDNSDNVIYINDSDADKIILDVCYDYDDAIFYEYNDFWFRSNFLED